MNITTVQNSSQLFVLTHPQKRIWYIENIYTDSPIYNIGGTAKIHGKVNLKALEKAINLFIKNNDALMLRFTICDGEPRQYLTEYQYIKFNVRDFTNQKFFDNWVREEASKPFQMINQYLFRFELFNLNEDVSGYFVKIHHIICDGWSISIMAEQVCKAYEAIINNGEYEVQQTDSYISYLEEEKNYLASERFLRNKQFWLDKFSDVSSITFTSTSNDIKGCRKSYPLPFNFSIKVKEWTKSNNISINAFFISVYLIYLYKITNEKDLVLETPVMNRGSRKWKSIFGMFTSTMPFRYKIDEQVAVLDMMKGVASGVKKCFLNQKYPYDILVQDLELRKKKINNLFNICINYYNTKPNTSINGMPIENKEFYNGTQMYSLQMIIRDWSDSGNLSLDFDYKISDYTSYEIDDMYTFLIRIAEQAIFQPEESIADINIMPEEYIKDMIYKFNDTNCSYPKNKTITQLFEEQVALVSEQVAISCDEQNITYLELNSKINQLARKLIAAGCSRGKIVVIFTERSIETVIGIYAVLKTGAAYLPIDTTTPDERLEYILDDSKAEYLLTNLESEVIKKSCKTVINLIDKELFTGDISNIDCFIAPNELAYIIYTSGSTGKPKGVMIEHQGLVNYICWAEKTYLSKKHEIMPLYSSLAFDLTVTSIFVPLVSGNELRVYKEDSKEFVLHTIVNDNKATIIKLTPAHLSLMKDMDLSNSNLRTMIVGGEDLKVLLARSIYKGFDGNIRICNEYGPTETVVGCMIYVYDVENDQSSVPIGTPADNVQVYILNEQLKPVPKGTIGEIYISGDGVARGYINREDLNHERFIKNPFINGTKMYKTGDLGRFREDVIEYIGRMDSQVKIHGYRIELGEIEKLLLNIPQIREAVVIDYTTKAEDKVLCAYLVVSGKIKTNEVKDSLIKILPEYMIPSHIMMIDQIPLTSNGKVDRKKLPKPAIHEGMTDEIIEFRNEQERLLITVVSSVLSIPYISIKYNFYQLGGDSIKAIQISSKLREQGYQLAVKDIMSHPILEKMALYIHESKSRRKEKQSCIGQIKKTPIVGWFMEQRYKNVNYYNQSCLLSIPPNMCSAQLNAVMKTILIHHDGLRMNYSYEDDCLYYNDALNTYEFALKEYDLSSFAYTRRQEEVQKIREKMNQSFDITRGILINACIFKHGQSEKQLLITAHHLIIDGISWRILLENLNQLIAQSLQSKELSCGDETDSYQTWAENLFEYSQKLSQGEITYWKNAEESKTLFPIEKYLGGDIINTNETIFLKFSKEETESLIKNCNIAYNTDSKELLITSLLRTMRPYVGKPQLTIELEHHGREKIIGEVDVSKTIGWFTSIYPYSVTLSSDEVGEQIKEVKESLRNIPYNGIGYGLMKYLMKELPQDSAKYVRFNYLGDFRMDESEASVKVLNQYGLAFGIENHMSSLIDINCYILGELLEVSITYSGNNYTEHFERKFAEDLQENLRTIIQHCYNKDSVEFTPSDFDLLDFTQDDLDKLFL